MKSVIVYFVALFAVTPVMGIASEMEPSIKIISSTSKVTFENMSIDNDDQGVVLTGKIKRSNYNSQVVPGHIDYLVVNIAGETLDQGAVQYSPSLGLRRWKYGSSFSLRISADTPADAVIKLTFHQDQFDASKVSPSANHSVNLLTM